jgi:hypothetical protein
VIDGSCDLTVKSIEMAGSMFVDRATTIAAAVAAADRKDAAKARPIDREQIIRCINRPQGHELGRRFSENNSALEGCGGSSCGFWPTVAIRRHLGCRNSPNRRAKSVLHTEARVQKPRGDPTQTPKREDFVTAQLQKSFDPNSFICLALILIVGVTLPATTVRAEDCLAAPNSPAREGTRWYSRLDRATQNRCWYMRALDRPARQRAASAKEALPTDAFAIPIPRPRPAAAGFPSSISHGDTDPFDSRPGYEIPLPRVRPSATGSASSLSQGDPGRYMYPEDAKASPVPMINGSIAEIRSSNPKEIPSPEADVSLSAPAANPDLVTGGDVDEASSVISEKHQAAPSTITNAADATAAPDVATPAAVTTNETRALASGMSAPQQTASESSIEVVAPRSDAAPPIDATIDDVEPSISKDSATDPNTSTGLRFNDVEPEPDVLHAEHRGPPAAATLDPRPSQPVLLSDDRERTALTDTIYKALMSVKSLYLIVAFVMATVVMSYYVVYMAELSFGR